MDKRDTVSKESLISMLGTEKYTYEVVTVQEINRFGCKLGCDPICVSSEDIEFKTQNRFNL